jgi:hypothetical protein
VEADEDTNVEVGGDVVTGPDASGAAKSRRKTRSVAAKQSVTKTSVAVSAVKAAEKKKKKRKRKASPPPAVETPTILTPQTREVESEEGEEDEATDEPPVVQDRYVRRLLSPAAKRQRELTQKTTEDALRQCLEAQRNTVVAQAMMHVLIRPRFFRLKPHVSAITR